jgi:hypothetical protein
MLGFLLLTLDAPNFRVSPAKIIIMDKRLPVKQLNLHILESFRNSLTASPYLGHLPSFTAFAVPGSYPESLLKP